MASVVVLGAGFGGLEAARCLRAALPQEHAITVVDRRDTFVVGAAKLWDLVGLRPLERSTASLAALRSHGIGFLQAGIDSIDLSSRVVTTSEGELRADFLVVALGAAFLDEHVAMLQHPAFNLYDPASVPLMREALEGFDGGRIVIAILGVPYKCPPAPFEAAFLVDHYLREKQIRDRSQVEVLTVQPSPLPVAGPEASVRVARTLTERGIELHTDVVDPVIEADAHVVRWPERSLAFDLLLGVPRHVPPTVVADAFGGWARPDPATLTTEHDRVYAIGDCAAIPNAVGEIPKAGVFAEAQGGVVAARIVAEIEGRDAPTFDGHGYCFLEFADGKAAKVEGDFFASPRPAVVLAEPDPATFQEKEAFVGDRLARLL